MSSCETSSTVFRIKRRRRLNYEETAQEMGRRLGIPEEKAAEIIMLRAAEKYRRENPYPPEHVYDDLTEREDDPPYRMFWNDDIPEDGGLLVEDAISRRMGERLANDMDNLVIQEIGQPDRSLVETHYRARREFRENHWQPERTRLGEWQLNGEGLMQFLTQPESRIAVVCSAWTAGNFGLPQEEWITTSWLERRPLENYHAGLFTGDMQWVNSSDSEIGLETFAVHHQQGDLAYLRLRWPHILQPGDHINIESMLMARVS